MARALYGEPLGAAAGVLHVVAVTRARGGPQVIRVGPAAPKSRTDTFVLGFARARVDAILNTGLVLRAEPGLRYDEGGPAARRSGWAPGLARWRREVAGFSEPPWLLILTRGHDLPADHPVWQSWARPIVLTGVERAEPLRRALPGRVEVIGHPAPSPRAALCHLREERGCRAVSIEAGPSVAVPFYEEPTAVDELMLSVFEGPLPPEAHAGRFLDEPELQGALRRGQPATPIDEPSGRWWFSRWVRRPMVGG